MDDYFERLGIDEIDEINEIEECSFHSLPFLNLSDLLTKRPIMGSISHEKKCPLCEFEKCIN